jgi:hypothetical protein
MKKTSLPSPNEDDESKDDGSEEEEAADLLVYFHARSGAGDSAGADDESIQVPGDVPRKPRTQSDASASSSPAIVARKRKRVETDELSASQTGMGSGSIFPGKSDGTGTAKEVGKGLYLDQAPPTGSVDLLNLLRQPGQGTQ